MLQKIKDALRVSGSDLDEEIQGLTICRIIRAETRGDKTRLVCEMVISDG